MLWFLFLGLVVFLIGMLIKWWTEHAEVMRKIHEEMEKFESTVDAYFEDKTDYAYKFKINPGLLRARDPFTTIAIPEDAKSVSFVDLKYANDRIEKVGEFRVCIENVLSIDVIHHTSAYAESVTTTEKQNALGRAVVGGVLFGGAGAVVGSTSAGSISTTTETLRTDYVSSELVFGLSDLDRPVIRFPSRDQEESERWLYRIRSAMAKVETLAYEGTAKPALS